MLIFEEMSLLHTWAQVHKRDGSIPEGINLLERIISGMERLPQDDKEKGQLFSHLNMTLAECHMQVHNYKEALDVCQNGYAQSKKFNKDLYALDFRHSLN